MWSEEGGSSVARRWKEEENDRNDEAEMRGFLDWKSLVGVMNIRGAYVWIPEVKLRALNGIVVGGMLNNR